MAAIQARVIHAMTIPFTVQLVGNAEQSAQLATVIDQVTPEIADYLHHIETAFSPFSADSQVSAARRGDWRALISAQPSQTSTQPNTRHAPNEPSAAHRLPHTDFAEIYALVQQAKQLTHGHFDPMHAGQYDPTGIVKGWAIEQAHQRFLMPLITAGTCEAAALGGGGDIQAAVADTSDFTWHIGVQDPANPNATIRTITLRNGAVATSGTSKRGEHITRSAHDLAQATVVDDHLTFADMWATTAISAGEQTFRGIVAGNPVAQSSLMSVFVRPDGSITQFAPGEVPANHA
ncbi:FAD:protein FMN transferase [Bifidobacterium cebidarum]|uniref:FAD:protein FMN transferase n=1 Tax=Bifidobacterium cebidarum TaxID=2650773 RepID=A0A6I1GMI6_9BIFI|nr:FAD:protein FMN transferase [Bifidobacterium cebidarum]KAB7786993.1 thiamine biosynthesis lipoprotein [Bifidobacterium cebidarum]